MKHGMNYGVPKWVRAGYTVKNKCERCGFKCELSEVFRVFHVDGNLDNCRFSNLKTLCSNCSILISKTETKWKQGELEADF